MEVDFRSKKLEVPAKASSVITNPAHAASLNVRLQVQVAQLNFVPAKTVAARLCTMDLFHE